MRTDNLKSEKNHSNVCCRFRTRLDNMDATKVKTYIESDHLDRILFRCNHCGCLFLYEFYEVVSFSDGDDKMYVSYIHVEDEPNAEVLAALGPFELMVKAKSIPHIFE